MIESADTQKSADINQREADSQLSTTTENVGESNLIEAPTLEPMKNKVQKAIGEMEERVKVEVPQTLSDAKEGLTKSPPHQQQSPSDLQNLRLDEAWHLALAESQHLPPEVITRILKIQKIHDYLTIREVKWLARFHQYFKKDADLVHIIVCYALWEIFSEITDTPLDTTKLDRELALKGNLREFFHKLELGPYTKDALEASFYQLRGLGNGKDHLNYLKAEREKENFNSIVQEDK